MGGDKKNSVADGWLKRVLDCISKLPPLIKVDIGRINLAKEQTNLEKCEIKDNKILSVDNAEFPLVTGKDNIMRPVIKGAEVEGLPEDNSKRIDLFEKDQRIFSRTDVAVTQLEICSPIEKQREGVIKKLKPLLEKKRFYDLGALLVSAKIIDIEDKRKDKETVDRLRNNLHASYGARGILVYNFFRSGILTYQILEFLGGLRCKCQEADIGSLFLSYWDNILTKGYPTVHFVSAQDTKSDFINELNWRLAEPHVNNVKVHTRSSRLIKKVGKWCEDYAQVNDFILSIGPQQQLGFTPEKVFKIAWKKD